MRRLLPVLLALLALALAAAVALRVPFANGPAEWQWPYREGGLRQAWAPALLVLGMLAVFWFQHRSAPHARWALPILVLLGGVLPFALAASQPEGFSRVLASVASRHSFSYLFDAGVAPGTGELLADYPEAAARLSLHSRTHPPGPLLAVRGMDALARRLGPPRGDLARAADEALGRELRRARERRRAVPAAPPSPWTAAALALLLPALSALAAWPLYRLSLAWGLSPEAALLAALLWLLVPARSLFTPSLDQALPLLLVLAASLAAAGGRAGALAAGLLAGLAVFTTYGYLPALPLLALIAAGGPAEKGAGRPAWSRAAWLGAGFLLPWATLTLATGYPALAAFRAAMAEHRAMAVATRSYATWLLGNPYDFGLLLGPPVLGLAAAGLAILRRADTAVALRLALLGWWELLALLLASGSVRGEVGRIWLFWMPFACLFAAAVADRLWGARSRPTLALLLAQAVLLFALASAMTFVR